MSEAIAKVLHDHADHDADRGLLVRFVVIAEQIGSDGEPWFRTMAEPDSVTWHRMGLLSYALANQQATINAEELGQ